MVLVKSKSKSITKQKQKQRQTVIVNIDTKKHEVKDNHANHLKNLRKVIMTLQQTHYIIHLLYMQFNNHHHIQCNRKRLKMQYVKQLETLHMQHQKINI